MLKRQSKKQRKVKLGCTVFFAILLFITAVHSLVYASECSYICNNMDVYLQEAYHGRCADFYDYKRAIRIKWGSREQWYGFELDNGDLLGSAQWDIEDCGFDADLFKQYSNQPMAFAYTKILRPFSSTHKVINISYENRWLLSDRIGAIRYEAGCFYFVFSVFLVGTVLVLLPMLLPWLSAMWKKRKNCENRKRKREKKEKFLNKQKNPKRRTNHENLR